MTAIDERISRHMNEFDENDGSEKIAEASSEFGSKYHVNYINTAQYYPVQIVAEKEGDSNRMTSPILCSNPVTPRRQ